MSAQDIGAGTASAQSSHPRLHRSLDKDTTSESSSIAARIESLRQSCNLLVWLLVAQCLIHTMLGFALRQEIIRRKQPSQAVSLINRLTFAQICFAAAWILQLRHRYTASTQSLVSEHKRLSWTVLREFSWLLSLFASVLELLAYTRYSPSWPIETPGVRPATQSIMLLTLISLRIALNLILVSCAAYRLALCHRLRYVLQQESMRLRRAMNPCAPWTTVIDDSAAFDSIPPITTTTTAIGTAAETANVTAYGAVDIDTYGLNTSIGSRESSSETSPLVTSLGKKPYPGPTLYSAQQANSGSGTGTNDSEVTQAEEALRSGAKKVRMYHQSSDYNPDTATIRRRLRIIMPFLWPSDSIMLQLRIFGCFLAIIAGRIVNVLVPLQFKIVVDSLAPKDGAPVRFAWEHVLLYAILRALQGSEGILNTLQSYVWIPVGQNTTKSISVAMFEHMHRLSLRFHVGRKTGEILRVQDRGVVSVVSLLSSVVFNVIPTFIDIILACYFFSVMFDLYFGTIVLTTMSSFMITTICLAGWRTRYRRLANYLDNEMEARAVDSLINFETVKYYNAEDFERKEYSQAVDSFQDASWLSNISVNMMNLGQNLIVQLGLFAGALLSAHRVYLGEMTVGDFSMLLAYITQLYVPLSWFGTYYRVIQKNFIDMEKLLELFDEPIEVKDPENPIPLRVPKGEIEFDNVSFSYDRQPTLKSVSFKVPAGSTVAIVGPSGSGKSTILRLLFRFYDVQSGSIKIDGQDIRSVLQNDLRRAIGVVPQDTVLFNDSIRYNIAYGRAGYSGGVTMGEVIDAADRAHIHDRIMSFTDQYETRVGERGQRLSGGEKQRVAIARTLLKDPRIVCLDEATSALDTTTERNIQTSLREMTNDRTTLIIAHRLSTIVHADVILILKNGEIVERGTHSELISNTDSVYYDMWMKQLADSQNKASFDLSMDPEAMDGLVPDSASHSHILAKSCFSTSIGRFAPSNSRLVAAADQRHNIEGGIGSVSGAEASSSHRSNKDTMSPSASRLKESLHLVLNEGSLPKVVNSQGWMSFGPLTAPVVPTSNINLINDAPGILCMEEDSLVPSTSSSLSGIDSNGVNLHDDGAHGNEGSAGLTHGTNTSGLLLNGLGTSFYDDAYINSDQDQDHQLNKK
ncbi:ATP-binding cassette-type vacuolar membrane transporter Hmt1 [Coemansia asiatica]|uniref:ATP-binding cassette-type vacuolar membrane transporter Hmt1 n=1 Tax=Coemansia asiatica TaxID=1052880 RepID=A0A9W8CLI9_9FUNG|nr:ATP-binding cassette-type vacuolar membrane transporter Hmt1 [Coemansia asiatica]